MEIANQKKQIKAKQKEEDNVLKEQIKAKLDNETKPVDIPKPTLKKEVVKPRIETFRVALLRIEDSQNNLHHVKL
jgi:hypothetical protein